jgi:hypothetical protein
MINARFSGSWQCGHAGANSLIPVKICSARRSNFDLEQTGPAQVGLSLAHTPSDNFTSRLMMMQSLLQKYRGELVRQSRFFDQGDPA